MSVSACTWLSCKRVLFVFTYSLHVHVGLNASIFSSEEHRAPCLTLAEKVWVCDDRISPMPVDKASDEQLQVQTDDQQAVLQRKMGDSNHYLPHTGQRWVRHWDKARSTCQIKRDQRKRNSEVLNLWSLNVWKLS